MVCRKTMNLSILKLLYKDHKLYHFTQHFHFIVKKNQQWRKIEKWSKVRECRRRRRRKWRFNKTQSLRRSLRRWKHQLLLLSEPIIKQDPRPYNKSPHQNLSGILIGRNSWVHMFLLGKNTPLHNQWDHFSLISQ